jgi:hypothetical protein
VPSGHGGGNGDGTGDVGHILKVAICMPGTTPGAAIWISATGK